MAESKISKHDIDIQVLSDVDIIQWAVDNSQDFVPKDVYCSSLCRSLPSASAGFMRVYKNTSSLLFVILFSLDGNIYTRTKNSTWFSWKTVSYS